MVCRLVISRTKITGLLLIIMIGAALSVCMLSVTGTLAEAAAETDIVIEKGPRFGNDPDQSIYQSRSFGNFVTDAVYYTVSSSDETKIRNIGSYSNTAVLLPNDVIGSAFPSAYITYDNILDSVDPEVSLAAVVMDTDQLQVLLEEGVSGIVLDTQTEKIDRENSAPGKLFQVSGLIYQYDVSAPAGEKIMKVSLIQPAGYHADQDDPGQILVITTVDFARQFTDWMTISVSIPDSIVKYLEEGGWTEVDFSESRISVIGTVENSIVSLFPRWIVIIIPLFAAVLIIAAFGKMRLQKEQHGRFRD